MHKKAGKTCRKLLRRDSSIKALAEAKIERGGGIQDTPNLGGEVKWWKIGFQLGRERKKQKGGKKKGDFRLCKVSQKVLKRDLEKKKKTKVEGVLEIKQSRSRFLKLL